MNGGMGEGGGGGVLGGVLGDVHWQRQRRCTVLSGVDEQP